MHSCFFEIQMGFQTGFPPRECYKFDWKKKWVFFFWMEMRLLLMECYVIYSERNVMKYFLKKKYDMELFFQLSFFIITLILKVSFLKSFIYFSLQTDSMDFEWIYIFSFKMTITIFLMTVTASWFDYIILQGL